MDYGIPEDELWRRYAKIAMESGDLEPLLLVDTLPLEVRPISWVPNIARLSEMTMKEPLMFLSRKSTYSEIVIKGEMTGKVYERNDRHPNASRGAEVSARFLEDDTVLAVEGVFVDRVEELTSIAKPNSEEDVHIGALETMESKYDVEKQMWDEAASIAFRNTESRGRAEKTRVWEDFTRAWILDFDNSLDADALQTYHMWKERVHHQGSRWIRQKADDDFDPDIKTMIEAQLLRENQNVRELDLADTLTAGYYFCRTTEGRLGWAAPHSRPGDMIYVVLGSKSPHLLRPQKDGTFKLIGQCYVQGIMNGEYLRYFSHEKETIRIS